MEYFIALFSQRNYYKSLVFSTSGYGNALNYMQKMHQIRRIIMVAQQHVFRRVLLDVRGILRVLEVFVQLLELRLAL